MDDTDEYFERLSEILIKYGFEWVVAQAEAEISEGRAVNKDVQALEYADLLEADGFARRSPRRRRASLVTTDPYNGAERLEILLRGVEAALGDRADLERAIMEKVGDIASVEFAPDEDALGAVATRAARRRHRLDRDRLAGGAEIQETLYPALQELRKEAGVGS